MEAEVVIKFGKSAKRFPGKRRLGVVTSYLKVKDHLWSSRRLVRQVRDEKRREEMQGRETRGGGQSLVRIKGKRRIAKG
ncbi:hypothetical protein E2C01_083448 [Portunus trituberculatus]|uniref:Uncharacterized protein n=1 Tax=Portunus trituberculatus TaxID=210409 RepID=A0A5B7IV72_PORTR|nr:hypothetical protein [Portunus trituberculatus]